MNSNGRHIDLAIFSSSFWLVWGERIYMGILSIPKDFRILEVSIQIRLLRQMMSQRLLVGHQWRGDRCLVFGGWISQVFIILMLWLLVLMLNSMGFSGTPGRTWEPRKWEAGPILFPKPTRIFESLKIWEWYGKLTIRGSHYWGSLEWPLMNCGLELFFFCSFPLLLLSVVQLLLLLSQINVFIGLAESVHDAKVPV